MDIFFVWSLQSRARSQKHNWNKLLLSLKLPKHTIRTPDIKSEEQNNNHFLKSVTPTVTSLVWKLFSLALRLTVVILTFLLQCDIKANEQHAASQCWLITTFNDKTSRLWTRHEGGLNKTEQFNSESCFFVFLESVPEKKTPKHLDGILRLCEETGVSGK